MASNTNQDRHPLDDAARFADRIIYAKQEQKDAAVLYYAATHIVSGLNTMGRLLITSPEPNSGKTTLMDMGVMMCQNPWMSDPTKWALQGKFKEPERPTVFMDEISFVFGLNGQRGRSNPIYKPAVEGYRKTATFSGQVDGAPQDFSSYCACVMAGGKTAVPPDLRTRCIVISLRPCPDSIELEDSLDDGVAADGARIGEQMHAWAQMFIDDASMIAREARKLHPKLRGRKLQVWGPLYVGAKMAGPDWVRRFLNAFCALALDASEKPVLSAEEQVLNDAGAYLSARETNKELERYLLSAELLRVLRRYDEKIYTSKSDAQMARLMTAALGPASTLTMQPSRKTAKGWHARSVLADYQRLMDSLVPEVEEEQEDEFADFFDIDDDEQTTETTETTVRSAA